MSNQIKNDERILQTLAISENYGQFVRYLLEHYAIDDALPECLSATMFAYLKLNNFFIPFREVARFFGANCTEALLMYRRLLYVYPHVMYLKDFREESIVIDEIETCLCKLSMVPQNRFHYSDFFKDQCIDTYRNTWELYNSNPFLTAVHVIYITGKRTGNYIKETTVLNLFGIDKASFRAMTSRLNKTRA